MVQNGDDVPKADVSTTDDGPQPVAAVTSTFVWAHGLLSSMAQEDEVGLFEWSAAADVTRIVRYDARGHGGGMVQYEDRAYRWSALVDDMLRMAGEGPFVGGGAGMGAATALLAAVRAPRRLEALVLVTPPAAWETRVAQATRYEDLADAVELRGPAALAGAAPVAGQPPFVAEGVPAAAEVGARHLMAMDKKVIPHILRGAARSDLAAPEEVRAVIVPTLILAWADDPGHPLSTAEMLADLMVQGELHVAHDMDEVRRWPWRVRDFLATV